MIIFFTSNCVGKANLVKKDKTRQFNNDFFKVLGFKEMWELMLGSKYIDYEELHLLTLANIEREVEKTKSKDDILQLFSFSNDVVFISHMIQLHKSAQERIKHCLSHYEENALQQLKEKREEEEEVITLDFEMDEDERKQLMKWYIAMKECHDLQKFKVKFPIFYLEAIYVKERFFHRWSLKKLKELKQG